MRRSSAFRAASHSLALTLAALVLAVGCSGGASRDARTRSSSAGDSQQPRGQMKTVSPLVLEMSVEELEAISEVVVVAKIQRRLGPFVVNEPSGDDRRPGSTTAWVFTDWSVIPLKLYKTDGYVTKGEPIRVALKGGVLAGQGTEYEAEADLAEGEKALLFLGRFSSQSGEGVSADRYEIVQLFQGKYRINDKTGIAENRDPRKDAPLAVIEAKLTR